MRKDVWATVRIHEGLLEEIEKYLKTSGARKKGYSSIAQFVADAVRNHLNR